MAAQTSGGRCSGDPVHRYEYSVQREYHRCSNGTLGRLNFCSPPGAHHCLCPMVRITQAIQLAASTHMHIQGEMEAQDLCRAGERPGSFVTCRSKLHLRAAWLVTSSRFTLAASRGVWHSSILLSKHATGRRSQWLRPSRRRSATSMITKNLQGRGSADGDISRTHRGRPVNTRYGKDVSVPCISLARPIPK